MDDHFMGIPEDRLALLGTYRMLHIFIPKHTPLTREKFQIMLKVAKDVEANRKLSALHSDGPVKMRRTGKIISFCYYIVLVRINI